MQLISHLRGDANLGYIFNGPRTGKRGAPKKHSGKINFNKIEENYFEQIYLEDDKVLYCGVVYSKALKSKIKLCLLKQNNSYELFFSTNLEMNGLEIYNSYMGHYRHN